MRGPIDVALDRVAWKCCKCGLPKGTCDCWDEINRVSGILDAIHGRLVAAGMSPEDASAWMLNAEAVVPEEIADKVDWSAISILANQLNG